MEVTAAERTTIYTNISPLAQRVNNYIQTQHSSIAAVAKDIGYSRTTVSRRTVSARRRPSMASAMRALSAGWP